MTLKLMIKIKGLGRFLKICTWHISVLEHCFSLLWYICFKTNPAQLQLCDIPAYNIMMKLCNLSAPLLAPKWTEPEEEYFFL